MISRSPIRRSYATPLLSAMAVALLALAAAGPQALAAARAARSLNVKDEGHLHAVHASGSQLVEEGRIRGTIPGRVRVDFNVGAVVTATFTIYAAGGSISGRGSGQLHSTGVYATFGGSLQVTGGTGRYTRAHGHGGLYGAINRKTYALTVQTLGMLHY